jgi:hypothetical protein
MPATQDQINHLRYAPQIGDIVTMIKQVTPGATEEQALILAAETCVSFDVGTFYRALQPRPEDWNSASDFEKHQIIRGLNTMTIETVQLVNSLRLVLGLEVCTIPDGLLVSNAAYY